MALSKFQITKVAGMNGVKMSDLVIDKFIKLWKQDKTIALNCQWLLEYFKLSR